MKNPTDRPDALDKCCPDPRLGPDQLVELLTADQRQRWQVGRPLPVATYLERFPQIRADSTHAVDLIWSEYLIRESLGGQPRLEEYTRGFPQFASLLKRQHEVHLWVEQAEPTGPSTLTCADSSLDHPPAGEIASGRGGEMHPGFRSIRAPGYEIIGEVGRGGMGVVYRAYDRRRQRVVALKMMRDPDPSSLYRFKREFHSLADISHRNLVTLHELVSDGRDWFFTMDLIDGVDFLTFLRRSIQTSEAKPPTVVKTAGLVEPKEKPSPSEACLAQGPARFDRLRACLGQLAEGVAVLHEAGWLHRDLKPSNVLVTHEGRVVILDFGLGAELGPTGLHHSSDTRLVGTVAYMSPEQAAGHPLTPASDWYSVGVILYEALTGRPPFGGGLLEMLQNKQRSDPPAPRQLVHDVPEDLDAVCVDLLHRDPAERPPGRDVFFRLVGMTTGPEGLRLPTIVPTADRAPDRPSAAPRDADGRVCSRSAGADGGPLRPWLFGGGQECVGAALPR